MPATGGFEWSLLGKYKATLILYLHDDEVELLYVWFALLLRSWMWTIPIGRVASSTSQCELIPAIFFQSNTITCDNWTIFYLHANTVFVKMKRHKTAPDRKVIEIALFSSGWYENRVKIASLLNTKFVEVEHVKRWTFDSW